MTATTAIKGMMKPPRSSLAFSVVAPLRAATESGAADEAVWARTGVLAMETASAAATDAFLKLILNSLLSFSTLPVPQWYIVDNPKFGGLFRQTRTVAHLHRRRLRRQVHTVNTVLGRNGRNVVTTSLPRGIAGDSVGRFHMIRPLFFALASALLSLAGSQAAAAQEPADASLQAMRSLDQRVAAIAYRLATSGRALCANIENLPGFAVHDLSQYGASFRPAAIRSFGLDAGPAVLALVPGGPADRAGLRLDDILLSLDGRALPHGDPGRDRSFDRMAQILDALDAAFTDGGAEIEVRRAGHLLMLHVGTQPGCKSRFQLIPSGRLNAEADGRYVQVTTAIAAYVADDAELAAVLAHEFAHNILGHRVRLDAARVSRGFLGNFGRNAARIRETEVEADRFSVYLLDRAGYDPEAAVRFWTRFGPRGLNFLGSPTHPNWRRRIASFEAEIGAIRRARAEGREPVPPFGAVPR